MRITESRLRQIIRRVLVESSGDVMADAEIVKQGVMAHPVISQLVASGHMAMMVNNTMVFEIVRDEAERVCGHKGSDHCGAVQDEVKNILRRS